MSITVDSSECRARDGGLVLHPARSETVAHQVIRMHEADRDRKKSARRTEHLLAQQKKLTEKRERIIEFALDGTFDKAERDRRLKMVEGYARFCTECLNCTPSEREKREYQFFSRWPSTSGERPVR